MLSAVGWGALAASSLVLGAILGVARSWSDGLVGAVLGFGAGALISSVAFELAEEGLGASGPARGAIGLALGAAAYFLANRLVSRIGGRSSRSTAGVPLALGGPLGGIPQQARPGDGPGSRSRPCSGSAWHPVAASVSRCWWRSSSPTCRSRSAPRPRCARPARPGA